MRTSAPGIRALALPWLLLLLCTCAREPAPPVGRARRVILVTCDTLRADRLGVYGCTQPTSPHIDAFARECAVFDEAFSCAPWTGPALSSLHTGLLPDEIGVPGGNRYPLPPQALTLAELARDGGCATAAVVSNWVIRRPPPELGDAGLQQGFQSYDDRMDEREPQREMYERRAPATTDAALEWLAGARARGEDRFFLWVHYQDPHGPYLPPPEWRAALARTSGDEPELPLGTSSSGRGQIPDYQAVEGERRPESYRARYDGEIRFFDEHLGRLFDWLKAQGWWEDSLIVFSADHGESLGEEGWWFCHGENLRREVVRVPLLLKYPRGALRPLAADGSPAARVHELAGHLDLWPTILEALGLPPHENRGISLFRSSLPAGRVLLQTLGFPGRPNRWIGVSDGRLRLVQQGTSAPRLFDEQGDPGELHDLAAARREEVLRLEQRSLEFAAHAAGAPLAPRALPGDPRGERALQSLGYGGEPDAKDH